MKNIRLASNFNSNIQIQDNKGIALLKKLKGKNCGPTKQELNSTNLQLRDDGGTYEGRLVVVALNMLHYRLGLNKVGKRVEIQHGNVCSDKVLPTNSSPAGRGEQSIPDTSTKAILVPRADKILGAHVRKGS